MTTKDELHHLIDALPESEAERLLGALRSRQAERETDLAGYPPSLRDAPWDDEPVTQGDMAALAEARDDEAHGRVIPDEDLPRVLGWQ